MENITFEKIKEIIDSADKDTVNQVYKYLWSGYVREDVKNALDVYIESGDLREAYADIITNEAVMNIVENGRLDCNLSYNDNINNAIRKAVAENVPQYDCEDIEWNSDGSLSFLIRNSYLTYDCFDRFWEENPEELNKFLSSMGISRENLEKWKAELGMKDSTIINVLEEAECLNTIFISAVISTGNKVTLSGDFGAYSIKGIMVDEFEEKDFLFEADKFLKTIYGRSLEQEMKSNSLREEIAR